MTTLEIAAVAEQAVDALTTALNDTPDHTSEVAEKLRGIAHSLLLAVGTIACTRDGDTAEKAGAASDALLAALPALDELADAMRQDEDARLFARWQDERSEREYLDEVERRNSAEVAELLDLDV